MRIVHVFLTINSMLSLFAICSNNFRQFRQQMEDLVNLIASSLEETFNSSHIQEQNLKPYLYEFCPPSCGKDFYDECHSTDEQKCYQNFPKHTKCFGNGILMSGQSAYRMSPENKKNNLTCEEASFICLPQSLNGILKGEVNQMRENRYSKAYVGSITGLFMSHPASLGHCEAQYDPRGRPWFITLSSGMSSLSLFLKITKQKNVDYAAKLTNFTITTLNTDSWIRISMLDQCNLTKPNQKTCGFLTKATTREKQNLKKIIYNRLQKTTKWNSNNYKNIQDYTKQQFESRSKQRNILMIITDSQPDVEELSSLVSNGTSNTKLIVVMIDNTAQEKLKQLACESKGLVINYNTSNSKMISQMRPMIDYFSQGLNQKKPVWSDAYEDAFEFGSMVTVVKQVFNPNGNLIAVAGLDITLEYLQSEFKMTEREILQELSSVLIYRQEPNMCDFCQYKQNCSKPNTNATKLYERDELWHQGEQKSGRICCGLKKVEAYILISMLVGFIVFLIAGCVTHRCYHQYKTKKQYQNYFQKRHPVDNNQMPSLHSLH